MEKCNCGREIRYETKNGPSCNKYVVCPTYDELQDTAAMLTAKVANLIRIARNLTMYRESSSLYKAALNDLERIIKNDA